MLGTEQAGNGVTVLVHTASPCKVSCDFDLGKISFLPTEEEKKMVEMHSEEGIRALHIARLRLECF